MVVGREVPVDDGEQLGGEEADVALDGGDEGGVGLAQDQIFERGEYERLVAVEGAAERTSELAAI